MISVKEKRPMRRVELTQLSARWYIFRQKVRAIVALLKTNSFLIFTRVKHDDPSGSALRAHSCMDEDMLRVVHTAVEHMIETKPKKDPLDEAKEIIDNS